MANNVFQVKRTSVSGRQPNTTGSYATNSQYISAGELALNMTDGILYTSNGSSLITIGANQVNQTVTGTLTVNAVSANGNVNAASYTVGSSFVANTVQITISGIPLNANGSNGTAGYVLTSNGSTGSPYWAAANSSISKYTANVGDGSSTSYTITHNLNDNNLLVKVKEISTGYTVYPDIQETSTNALSLQFVTAPTANQFYVIVVAV